MSKATKTIAHVPSMEERKTNYVCEQNVTRLYGVLESGPRHDYVRATVWSTEY